VQLKQLLGHCTAAGVPLDTTTLHAQQGELVNQTLKELLFTMSGHQHVASDELDDEKHLHFDCMLAFTDELISKEWAVELGATS
jgi:hypothetical protein